MQAYQVGETVVHWAYGSGKIVTVDDKGLPGQPCFYYGIEGSLQTLWVPVDEDGGSSLHLPTSRSDFKLLINILRGQGEKMSNNRYQRCDQLDERMLKASPEDLCLVIRDLTYHAHSHKLTSYEVGVLKRAEALLLDEWVLALGTPRENARRELKWVLIEGPKKNAL